MSLLDHLQHLPAPLITYLGPALIVGCFLFSFGHWLHAKWYVAITIYLLSGFTNLIAGTVTKDPAQTALVGGILAPALYSLLFVCFGVIRVLRMPYGRINVSATPKRSRNGLMRLLKGTIWGCVGGVTGSSLGALFSIFLLFLALLVTPGFNINWHNNQGIEKIVDGSITIFGSVGSSLGVLTGWGFCNIKQLSNRVLIRSSIHVFIVLTVLRRFWSRVFTNQKPRR
ncbi:hypothetical protein HJG54_13225 [Leptolyngbya sp. NK1-12]|uniref:Uncharacterized protein n=1 Tax=Leptolyngbya sp. NK1-12 TaxID=2547451 RepID=A0AA97AQK7_9CYAN|nr:hypothetical protein [Leptolyngbya sp. NK1-12]WNZ23718.1 hypothetical protein HJG54_13225 [Leptolyngbya sp. NK1-12]